MSEVLVTGGSGLVGSRLLRRFVTAGIETRALIRPGRELPDGVRAVEGDLLDPDTLEPVVADVSAVVHLAASFRTRDDDETWRVNLDGTRNLIDAVRTHAPDARVLMASTGNVYDADATHPAREDDPVHPTLACCGLGRKVGESRLHELVSGGEYEVVDPAEIRHHRRDRSGVVDVDTHDLGLPAHEHRAAEAPGRSPTTGRAPSHGSRPL